VRVLAKADAHKTGTDMTIPPPLKALGGWLSAEWFLPSVVIDEEVVGLTLPDLPGRKKQSFRIVERSAAARPAGNAKKTPVSPEGPAARSIFHVLDWIGATHVAAFRRTTLIFESKPVLYFANIPLANLKVRAANRLRRELMESRLLGCIVHTEANVATAMFWPETELDITGFITDAAPEHALHIEFAEAEEQHRAQDQERRFSLTRRAPPAPPAKRLDDRERQQMQTEKQALLQEIQSLRTQVARMQESQSELGAMEALGLDDARLKSMLRLLHPDKHGGSEAANDAAKWLNNLRDVLKKKA
jgi:hypothetical protein